MSPKTFRTEFSRKFGPSRLKRPRLYGKGVKLSNASLPALPKTPLPGQKTLQFQA